MQTFVLGASFYSRVRVHVAFFVSFCLMIDADYSMKCYHRVPCTQCCLHGTMHAVLCARYPLPLAFAVPGAIRCNSCVGGAGEAPEGASAGRSKVGSQGRKGFRAEGGK